MNCLVIFAGCRNSYKTVNCWIIKGKVEIVLGIVKFACGLDLGRKVSYSPHWIASIMAWCSDFLQIIICAQELESRANSQPTLDLYALYCSSAGTEKVADLKQKFNESTTAVDLTDYSPSCIASVLKKFLRELPDPVIPVQWYDRFLEASSKFNFLSKLFYSFYVPPISSHLSCLCWNLEKLPALFHNFKQIHI